MIASVTNSGRRSNLELLRIFAMLTIVIGHCSFAYQGERSVTLEFMSRCSRIAVNVFLLIGCWFMTDRPAEPKKVARLYLATAVTTVSLTVIALALGAHPPAKDVARGFFPFLGRPLWFISAYLCLMIASPHLRNLVRGASRLQQNFILIAVAVVSLICTLPDPQDAYVLDVLWFCGIYLVLGIAKSRWPLIRWARTYRWLLIGFALVVYAAIVCLAKFLPAARTVSLQWVYDVKSLPNVVCAAGIFFAFLSFDLGRSKSINFAASGALGAYMLHETPAFREYLWCEIFRLQDISSFVELRVLGVAAVVYAAGLAWDFLRRRTFDAALARTRLYAWLVRGVSPVMGFDKISTSSISQ